MPTLKAYHGISLGGQHVDNLTFTLITPLGAKDYNILLHD
jgi:hypothetical protein